MAQKATKAIGGEGMKAGGDKHRFIKKLMNKYEKKFGERPGVEFEKHFKSIDGNTVAQFDVIDHPGKVIFDFKFGRTGMSAKQLAKYRNLRAEYTIKIINELGEVIKEYPPIK